MKRLSFFIVVFLFTFGLGVQVSAWSISSFSVTKALSLTDSLVTRIVDLIYFLNLQKKYLFNNYADPNVYSDWLRTTEIEKTLTGLIGTSTVETATTTRNFNQTLKPVASSSLPAIKTPAQASTTKNQPKTVINPTLFSLANSVSTSTLKIVLKETGPKDFNSSEILIYTNQERSLEALNPLSGNKILNQIARLRLADLFDNQYFEHQSPDGKSAPDLAKLVDYKYSIIGENLALGNFNGDQGIVKAWMNSPGHRANILNPKYTELGVAESEGDFQGRNVTIAVQIFGLPQSLCTPPEIKTKELINQSSAAINQAENQAKLMYENLLKIKNDPNLDQAFYNQKVQEYNYFAKSVNEAVANFKKIIENYNQTVSRYNNCLTS